MSNVNAKKRVLLCICFDGGKYYGWQAQPSGNTVQQHLQSAIETVLRAPTDLSGCGRTDSGVHAKKYFCHIDIDKAFPTERLPAAINLYLYAKKESISVMSASEVDSDFHSRYYIKRKQYVYKIQNNRFRDPFLSGYAYAYYKPLDLDLMRSAARELTGKHNFTSFMADNSKIPPEEAERTIYSINIDCNDPNSVNESRIITISITADGFLYKMARIIVGTLLEVSEKKILPSDIPDIINKRNRKFAGRTVEPCGLYLNDIEYYTKEEVDEIMRLYGK